MNEQEFDFIRPNPEGSKQSEDEPTGQKTPEDATEQEKQESSFESRYEQLKNKSDAIERDGDITFEIVNLQPEGLQTLINKYGSDTIFNIIEKKRPLSTFELIKALEVDPKKRTSLFEEIKTDAQQEQEDTKFDSSSWGKENFAMNTECSVIAMKALDSFLGKIIPNRSYKLLGCHLYTLGAYLSRHDEGQKLKNQLAEAGNDIFHLVENRDKNRREQIERLHSQADKLHEELTKEVERVTQELNTELEKRRAKIVSDLSKVGILDTASEEMKTALEGALEKVETEIANHVERTEKEIADKTAPLQKLMSEVEGLHRSY